VCQLDPALIRSGRIDYVMHFDLATRDQARRLFVRFFESETSTDAHPPRPESSDSGDEADVTGDADAQPWHVEYLKRLDQLAATFAASVSPRSKSMADLQVGCRRVGFHRHH